MHKNIINNKVNYLKIVRNYFHGTDDISYRRFKKALNKLVELEDPQGLVIAASIHPKNMNDEEFNLRRVKLLNKAIGLNFSHAMVALAEDYYHRNNVEKAFKLYERAASLNNAHAFRVISRVYEFGIDGYEKNADKAKEFREKAQRAEVWNDYDGFEAEHSDYE